MPTPATPAERPLRKDAQRNRERILDAAREVFAEYGLDATLDDIADHAGVGVGTVYRRFPDKHALINALADTKVDNIVAAAHEGLAHDDPWEGLVHYLVRGQELLAADRGLRELLYTAHGDRCGHERVRDRIAPLVEEMLSRAQDAGVVRADIAVTDLPLTQMAIGAINDATRDVAPETWRRLLTIVLDGLRPQRDAPSDLPAPPLTFDQFADAMACAKSTLPRRGR